MITLEATVAAISNGAVSCALLAVNNIRDIEGDTKAGKLTLAVRIGDTRARRFYMLLIFIAIFSGFIVTILASLSVVLAIPLLSQIRYLKERDLIQTLGATGRFQLLLGALITIGAIINL